MNERILTVELPVAQPPVAQPPVAQAFSPAERTFSPRPHSRLDCGDGLKVRPTAENRGATIQAPVRIYPRATSSLYLYAFRMTNMIKLRTFSLSTAVALLVLASCRDHLTGPPNTTSSSDTIAYWTFDGNLNDVTGNGHDGSAAYADFGPDRFGNGASAVSFTPNMKPEPPTITVTNAKNLNFTASDSYTISAWVKLSGVDTTVICSRNMLPTYNQTSYGIGAVGGNYFANVSGDPNTGVGLIASFKVSLEEWHMVTLVVAAHASIALYLDSAIAASMPNPIDSMMWPSQNIPFVIGPILGPPASLDNLIVLHHAMSASEVAARFHESGWYEGHGDTVGTPPLRGTVITGNKFVAARVEAQTGLITFIDAGGIGATNAPPGTLLSYVDKSFLSIVADTFLTPVSDTGYYSNNNLMPINLSVPIGQSRALPGYQWHNLGEGVTSKIGDTIETVWKNLGEDTGYSHAFDFVQDVYPVEFDSSGQIVVSVKVINHGSISHSFAAQYLNDGLISDGKTANDNVFIVNNLGLVGDQWQLYQGNVPTYFAAFSEDPRQSGSGSIPLGIGFLNDVAAPAPMGLIPPSAVYHCDWPVTVGYGFGAPNQTGPTSDMATLLQWSSVVVAPGRKAEIMRTSYGTNQMPLSQMPIH